MRPSTWAAGDSTSSVNVASTAAPPPALPQRKKPSWATRKAPTRSTSSHGVDLSPSSTMSPSTQATPQVDNRRNGPRVLVFVIGGVMYSEIKCAFDLQQEFTRDCFVGSTHFWSPDSFVHALKNIGGGSGGGSSRRGGGGNANFYGYIRPPPRPRPVRTASREGSSSGRGERDRERGSSRREGERRSPPPPRPRRSPPPSSSSREDVSSSSSSRVPPRPYGDRQGSGRHRRAGASGSDGGPPVDMMSRVNIGRTTDQRRDGGGDGTATEPKKKNWFGF